MRGRPNKPTALKLLAGAQPCRVNLDEPKAPEGQPTPPPYLEGVALDLWEELSTLLYGMGVLTLTDRHALGLLCDSYSQWRSDPKDMKVRDEFRKLLGEFGLTPGSRSRIKVSVETKDDLDEFRSAGKRKAT